ncbi:MAG TPA: hypothetical protein VFQ90_17990 [Stellaceae bacterium]|jgi:adenylate kinase family enzyme|nr:hypothetical protein [Stellaceae bacterium]
MGKRLGLPAVHLDTLYWLPGSLAPPPGAHRAAFAAAFVQEAWISEGNFIETFDLRLPRADLVVILDRPRWLCLWRVVRRAMFSRDERPDLAPGCPEQFDRQLLRDIWCYEAETRPRLEAALFAYGGNTPIVRLHSDRAVAAFLAELIRSPPSPAP